MNYQKRSVAELDQMYWDLYGEMRKYKDHNSYQNFCVIGGAITKELDRRGLIYPADVADAIKKERELNN